MDKHFSTGSVPGKMPSEHQRQIDAIQASIRAEVDSGQRSLFRPPPARPAPSKSPLDHRIAEEMEFIVRRLEHLGGTLANDPILLRRHALELQSIDLIKQSLGHLAQVVAAEDKALAAEQVTLTELKAKLQRKALKPIGEG